MKIDELVSKSSNQVPLREARLFIDGEWVEGEAKHSTLLDKFSQTKIASIHNASSGQVDVSLNRLAEAQRRNKISPEARSQVLKQTARLLEKNASEFVATIVKEAGFTLHDARREVQRAANTLNICGEEAKRIHGHVVPVDGSEQEHEGRHAFTFRKPLGVVCAITPFNSPLNTVIHKVGPAIAAGNSVCLKPSSLTPLTSELLVRCLVDAGLPPEHISLLHGSGREVGQWLLEHPVPSFYAFTGSTAVGEDLIRTIGVRRSQLELGSLSSTIVCSDANILVAAQKCAGAGFRKAGQVCTSIQRLYVEEPILQQFLEHFIKEVEDLESGDPSDSKTTVGPLISRREAERVEYWLREAVEGGAKILTGGTRRGSVIEPTVVINADPSCKLMRNEIFGPVVLVQPFTNFEDVLNDVNDTPYGLSAGIFTQNMDRAFSAVETLRMGAVHINETSNGRFDSMPYSGTKASGLGQEGPRYAIREMTEECLMTIRYGAN